MVSTTEFMTVFLGGYWALTQDNIAGSEARVKRMETIVNKLLIVMLALAVAGCGRMKAKDDTSDAERKRELRERFGHEFNAQNEVQKEATSRSNELHDAQFTFEPPVLNESNGVYTVRGTAVLAKASLQVPKKFRIEAKMKLHSKHNNGEFWEKPMDFKMTEESP